MYFNQIQKIQLIGKSVSYEKKVLIFNVILISEYRQLVKEMLYKCRWISRLQPRSYRGSRCVGLVTLPSDKAKV